MPRKYFRKVLPSHESIRENRHVARLGPRLQHHNLWHLHRRSVAGGVAVGLFAGLIPGSNPVQFLAAALLAVALKVNLPIAIGATLYSNPFTIVPLYFAAFKLGELVMLRGGGDVPQFGEALQGKSLSEWLPAVLDWVASAGKPLLVGIPLLAAALAIVGYVLTDALWKAHVRMEWRKRALRRRSAHR